MACRRIRAPGDYFHPPPLLHFTRRRTKLTHSECLATESEAEHTEMSGPARTPGPTSFSFFLSFFLSFFSRSPPGAHKVGRSSHRGPPVDRVFGSVGLRPSRRPPQGTGLLSPHTLRGERLDARTYVCSSYGTSIGRLGQVQVCPTRR